MSLIRVCPNCKLNMKPVSTGKLLISEGTLLVTYRCHQCTMRLDYEDPDSADELGVGKNLKAF